MHPNDDFLSAPELDYDGFRAAMREDWGWFTPARETNIFASKVRTRRVFGFAAVDLTCNATRLERTELDIRRDDMEYYYAVVQLTGGSTIIQDDRVRKCRCWRCRPARFHKTRNIRPGGRAPERAMAWSASAAPEPGVASRFRAARWRVRSPAGASVTSALSTRS